MSNTTLVIRAQMGDHDAFAQLVHKHQHYAYGVAVAMVSDFDLAQDIVQEAFILAFQELKKLQDPNRFSGWLRGIVRNTGHRALRELTRAHQLATDLSFNEPLFAPSPDLSLEEAERHEIVRRALARLNDKNREIVSLYYVDCLSYTDIATFLNVTETTVQGRLQRARKKLKKELKMVKERFQEEHLPEDFSTEIKRLLNYATANGEAQEEMAGRLAEFGQPAVEDLCKLLEDPDHPGRHIAARALCEIGDERALQPVLQLVFSESGRWWRKWSYGALSLKSVLNIPGVKDALLEVLRESKPESGISIRILSHAVHEDDVFAAMRDVFRKPDSRWRSSAMRFICDHSSKERALEIITEAMQDNNDRMVDGAVIMADKRDVLPPLKICVQVFKTRASRYTLNRAAQILLKHGDAGIDALQDMMNNGTAFERASAALVLVEQNNTDAACLLKQELLGLPEDADVDFSRLSDHLNHMANKNPTQVGPLVAGFIPLGDTRARSAAHTILVRQKGLDALPHLKQSLAHCRPRNSKASRSAFHHMVRMGKDIVPEIKTWLNDDNWLLRKAAASLLKRWDELTPDLKEQLANDPHIAVRHAATSRPETT